MMMILDMLYSHIHADISRNISKHNIRTSMNERTRFFIKIYLSHIIRKGWCWLCVRGELETEIDCHILTQSSSDHSSTSLIFWMACSTVGPEGPSPLFGSGSHSGTLSPTVAPGYIIVWRSRICTEFNHVHRSRWYSDIFDWMNLFPPFLCLFTQVHLLIDGSVEGQYVTDRNKYNYLTVCKKMSASSFKNIPYKNCLEIIYLIYIYRKSLALNNLQNWYAIKTKPNLTKSNK